MQVGGVGHVVEIDETSVKKKSKYNRGTRHEDRWVFGGFDRTTKKWFGIVVGNDRTKPTLSSVIKKYIRPGTLIMSDSWPSYVSVDRNGDVHNLENNRWLVDMGYRHQYVNHSENFVDPDSGAHTQGIEGTWEVKIKQNIKAMRGCNTELLASYLDLYLWKSWYLPQKPTVAMTMNGIIKGIKNHYN
jgi:IS1 family transposase